MAEMFRTLMLEHIHFANLFASKLFQTLQFVILFKMSSMQGISLKY